VVVYPERGCEGDVSNKTTNQSSPAEVHQRSRRRGRLHERMHAHPALALTSKIVVTTVGVVVVGAGLVMMVTPGPGVVALVVGLAILATEWDWADRWLDRARQAAHDARERAARTDPRVRRRRIILGALGVVLVVTAVAVYVAAFGWPSYLVDGWNWVQGLAGWVPDLPGM
jgi:uncharacterized protein (TIGR02611 family)